MATLDLRHVASPGLRDLVHLANTDDFDRVTETGPAPAAAARTVNPARPDHHHRQGHR